MNNWLLFVIELRRYVYSQIQVITYKALTVRANSVI